MYLNEILQLDKKMSSIKKIDIFLAGCNRRSSDYYKAFAYRNLILHSNDKSKEALESLCSVAANLSSLEDANIIILCDAIIEITLDLKDFTQARKYIDEKKKYLKVSNEILNTKDEILLAKARKDYHRAIEELKVYLNEILSGEELCWAHETLAEIYYLLLDYDSYLRISMELERTYLDTLNTKKLIQLYYNRLVITHSSGNYIKAIGDGNRLINEYDLDDEQIILVATILLDCYIRSRDFHKARIIESNYEDKLENVSTETAIKYCNLCIELYTQSASVISVKHYESLVDELSKRKPKVKNKTSGVKTASPIPLEYEVSKEEILKVKEPENNTPVISHIPAVQISTNYLKLEKLFSLLNGMGTTKKFRELLRISLIELSKIISFEEAYLLYFDKAFYGLHYKKERVYDKHLTFEEIHHTFNFVAQTDAQEVFIDPETCVNVQSIVTKEPFSKATYGIAFPIYKEDICYGSITFWASVPFLDKDLSYETLKLITQMINHNLLIELKEKEIRIANKKMFFIYENMQSGVKELVDGHIHLSLQAKDILGSELEDMDDEKFRSNIHAQDLARYEALLTEIYRYLPVNKSIEYRYLKKSEYVGIKETFFPSYENGIISIYSLIEDQSSEINEKIKLHDLAYIDSASKLGTEVKLADDLNKTLEHRKLSLSIFEVYDIKLYEELYGINFVNQLILAIANELKSYFAENFNVSLYHLTFDRYAILFKDINDKRTLDNMLGKTFHEVANRINNLNGRIHLRFTCGIYRVSKSSNISDQNKVISYAYEALEEARKQNGDENHIVHYDLEEMKQHLNENQLVTHISEAIDHGKIGITYKQVVHLATKELFAYYALLSLDNYDVDYSFMEKVIRRRGLEERLDKYTISCVSKELKMLRETLKGSIFVFIPLNPVTVEANILPFVETQNHMFKTTKSDIVFYVKSANHPALKKLKESGYHIASQNLMDVYQSTIDFYIYDLQIEGFASIQEVMQFCEEKNVTFILSGVNTKEEVLQAEELGIKYIYGNFYKKPIRMKNVLKKFA